MPVVGEVDLSKIIANLGDDTHGLRAAKPALNDEAHEEFEVFRASWGAVDMSSSMALNTVPKLVWDVNGYYAALGIPWPFTPNRKQLREAYQAKEGWKSDYLTYVLKQLLNPEVRDQYDKMELGKRMHDLYAQKENARKLANVAAEESEARGKLVTVEDLMKEVDREEPKMLDEETVRSSYWDWGYFLFKSRKYDSDDLETWQTMLVKALAEKGLVTKFSVGYIGKTQKEFFIKEHDGHKIFFLNEDVDPTPELAEAAASLHSS